MPGALRAQVRERRAQHVEHAEDVHLVVAPCLFVRGLLDRPHLTVTCVVDDDVEPAEVGGYPRWFGLPVSLERSLCQAMRRVLASKDTDPSWSKRAVTQLELQRESHAFLEDSSLPLEEDPDGRCRWWTFAGGAGNRVLAGLLELELGERVSPGNTFITFADGAAESSVAIRQAIDAIAARAPLGWYDAAPLVDPGQRSRVSKFQPCLPSQIEHGLIARETMSIDDANEILTEWKRGISA